MKQIYKRIQLGFLKLWAPTRKIFNTSPKILIGLMDIAKSCLLLLVLVFSTTTVKAQSSQVLDFDGNEDRVIIPASEELEFTTGTIEMWIKPGQYNHNGALIAMRADTSARFSFHINPANTAQAVGIWDGSNFVAEPGLEIFTGIWYHLALVISEDDVRVYVNGEQKAILPASINTSVSGLPLVLGSLSSTETTTDLYKGKMDEVRIWDTERTQAEIQNAMHMELTRSESNLLAYYNFENASASPGADNSGITKLTDIAGNGHDGTLTDFSLSGSYSNWDTQSCLITESCASYFEGGNGTPSDPYQISTIEQLQSIQDHYEEHFILVNDIDATETSSWNTGEGFEPLVAPGRTFYGSLDGDGHIINGLTINRPATDNVGLFSEIATEVRNIGLENIDIQGNNSVGGVVGFSSGATISNSFVKGTITASSSAGGLVGFGNATVRECFTRTNVSGIIAIGGIMGNTNANSTIIDTYAAGELNGTTAIGGLYGSSAGIPIVTNSYWDTEVSEVTLVGNPISGGGIGKTTAEMKNESTYVNWDFNYRWDIDPAKNNGYPYLTYKVPFEVGKGTKSEPYQVANLEQLQAINTFADKSFELINNIDAVATDTANFTPIENFSGSFDGNDFVILDLTIDSENSDVGLFKSTTATSVIKNVGLENVDISSTTQDFTVGGLVGYSNGEVNNVYVTGDITATTADFVGGLIGIVNSGSVSNAYSMATVSGENSVGGLVGEIRGGSVDTTYSTGSVAGNSSLGGLIGNSTGGTVTESYWDTQTSNQSVSAGGTGKTTSEMKTKATFSEWDFTNTWNIEESVGYPKLFDTKSSSLTIHGDEGWRIISSPVVGASYAELLNELWTQGMTGADIDSGASNIFTWNEPNQSWKAPSNLNEEVPAGKGIAIYVYSDVDADGNPDSFPKEIESDREPFIGNASPNITFTDTETPQEDGWNLIGNPYDRTIDWDAGSGWTRNNLDNSFYVWSDTANGGAGAYLSWNGESGTLKDGKIAPWQGFWVKALDDNPSLSFTEQVKSDGATFYKNAPSSPEIKFTLEGEKYTSSTVLWFSEAAHISKDPFDAYKLESLNPEYLSVGTRIHEGPVMDIQSLPKKLKNQELNIVINGSSLNGDFTLRWDMDQIPEAWNVHLIDKQGNKTLDLREQEGYTFSLRGQPSPKLQKTNSSLKSPTPNLVKSKSAFTSLKLRINSKTATDIHADDNLPEQIKLNQNYPNPFNPQTNIQFALPKQSVVSLEIFDILGRKVATLIDGQSKQAGYHTINFEGTHLSSGIYLYRLQTDQNALYKTMSLIK